MPKSKPSSTPASKSLHDKLTAMGVKEIFAPRVLPKACRFDQLVPPTKALIAVLYTELGDHLSELYDSYRLRCARQGIYAARYYLVSIPQIDEISDFYQSMRKLKVA